MRKRKKKKYYVVWQGRETGVFDSWEECRKQIDGYPGAVYKSFDTREQALKAWQETPDKYIGKKNKIQLDAYLNNPLIIKPAITVDASSRGNPGIMEYRGVVLPSGKEIFKQGPFAEATNNIGEFLAIVHALALMKKKNLNWPVYSDSQIAITWIKNKKCKTNLKQTERNKNVFILIQKAEKWLIRHNYSNPIIKWDTENWGEIPADFGRK